MPPQQWTICHSLAWYWQQPHFKKIRVNIFLLSVLDIVSKSTSFMQEGSSELPGRRGQLGRMAALALWSGRGHWWPAPQHGGSKSIMGSPQWHRTRGCSLPWPLAVPAGVPGQWEGVGAVSGWKKSMRWAQSALRDPLCNHHDLWGASPSVPGCSKPLAKTQSWPQRNKTPQPR